MTDTIARILPLAVAAAVNPMAICVVIAVLSRSRKAATEISAGFSFVFLVFGVLVIAVGLRLSAGPGLVSAIIDIVAGLALGFLGVRSITKRRREAAAGAAQRKRHPRRLGLAGCLAAGVVLAITDVSSLIPYGVALKDISLSPIDGLEAAVADAIFLIVALSPIVLPVILTYAAPSQAKKVLDPVNRTLTRHGDLITGVVLLLITAYLLFKGVRAI